jgi:ribosomal-protein-alanine acetyltransferase
MKQKLAFGAQSRLCRPAGKRPPAPRRERFLDGRTQGAAEFVIRAAAEGDLDAIYALECASFASDQLSRRGLRRFLKASHRPLMVARSAGRIIGYVLVRLYPHSARIYSLAVAAAHGRRGVGRELLHAAERYARAHGRLRLRLEVRYDNVQAIALYEKLGYRNFGRYPGYYADGAEALRLEKSLVAKAGEQK